MVRHRRRRRRRRMSAPANSRRRQRRCRPAPRIPDVSAFVSANAGSGKTHVLVNRVIRLLLDGVKPEKILCITFTKAAAANMAERVFAQLGHWVALDDTRTRCGNQQMSARRSRIRRPRTRARRIVRHRAGNAGRAEGADHPRAVHAAAATVSVRGQCAGALLRARRPRPERNDGARQPQVLLEAAAQPAQRRRAAH